jgi:LL-diaminopimelate aminotransferase
MKFDYSQRLSQLPPYVFIEIDRKKKKAIQRGIDIIDLGVGDPDLATPQHIREAMKKAIDEPKYHRYPFGPGLLEFRKAIARWCKVRFGVELDAENEIHALIGSKEGIGHIHLAFVNPGDVVLCPEPAYPVYKIGTIYAGGTPYLMPLLEENDFLPDFDSIPEKIIAKAKMVFINYPNNPTAACANIDFFRRVIKFARKHNIIVVNDAAYSEIYYGGRKPISFLELPGAMELGIEFHSLSKTYNMTGWRIGWACGNRKIIKGLSMVKENIDSGVFGAIQVASIEALNGPQDCVDEMRRIYEKRRDLLSEGLNRTGWKVKKPEATFYLWAKVPQGYSSLECVENLLEEAGILSTPGNALGPSGEGYVRFALTVDEKRIEEAVDKLGSIKW